MPRTNTIAEVSKAMGTLMAQRKKHLAIIAKSSAKVAEIEKLFEGLGVSLPAPKAGRKGKTKKARAGKQRKRGVFKQTAEEFVLGLLKGKSLTTREISMKWKGEGRGGKPDNSLTKLVQAKKLKRTKVKGAKGSTYSLA